MLLDDDSDDEPALLVLEETPMEEDGEALTAARKGVVKKSVFESDSDDE